MTRLQRCILLIALLTLAAPSFAAPPDIRELEGLNSSEQPPTARLDVLIRSVRDGRIGRDAARRDLTRLLADVRSTYRRDVSNRTPRGSWVFPVAGYGMGAITGGKRHGYIASGYDFYTGNRHGGHPSLDIFIRDRNQDCRDDRTGRPVQVLSMTAGIVVSAENDWQPGSRLRGGRYLWIYDPDNDLLVYYAHNEELLVRTGEYVRPGDAIATVGRSGWNAAKRRSPTHLHLTVLTVDEGRMKPVDVYHDLQKLQVGR